MKKINKKDILPNFQKLMKAPGYSKKSTIQGVILQEIKNIPGERGTFQELMRFNKKGESALFKNFQILQINRSLVLPGAIKAWHLHLQQEDIWYVPPESYFLVGLLDLRKKSPTSNLQMRFVMGADQSQFLLIPRGVAHGMANLSTFEGEIIYFVNQHFNPDDELRLPWDLLGKEFWQIHFE